MWFENRRRLVQRLLLVGSLFGVSACAAQRSEATAAVASTKASEAAFREIVALWNETADRPNAELEHKLRDFIARYPTDGQVQRARVYLAWVFAVTDRRFLARDQLEALGEPSGSIRDLAELVRAVQLLRGDQIELALAKLEILKGRFIDETVRALHSEQLLLAMLATQQYSRAHLVMLDWLALAGGDRRRAIRERLLERVREMPSSALETALSELQKARGDREYAESVQWLSAQIREHLEQTAVTEEDSELAQRLIEDSPGLDSEDQRLAEVAGARPARIDSRKVGLVLEFGDDERERRSAAVLAGASAALELPDSASDPTRVQLDIEQVVVQPASTAASPAKAAAELERQLTAALVRLAGDGSSVLIAGISPLMTRIAGNWARQRSIPVILLGAPPSAGAAKPPAPSASVEYAFHLGISLSALSSQFDAWAASQGLQPRVVVGSPDSPCPSADVIAGRNRFPIDEWKHDGVRAVLLGGPRACSQRAADELSRSSLKVSVVQGLFGVPVNSPGLTHQLSTGRFPATAASGVTSITRWAEGRGSFPNWYQSLGHDAALLARLALEDFPLQLIETPDSVAALHRRAQSQLLGARSNELWASASQGFDADGRLRYPLSVEPFPRAR